MSLVSWGVFLNSFAQMSIGIFSIATLGSWALFSYYITKYLLSIYCCTLMLLKWSQSWRTVVMHLPSNVYFLSHFFFFDSEPQSPCAEKPSISVILITPTELCRSPSSYYSSHTTLSSSWDAFCCSKGPLEPEVLLLLCQRGVWKSLVSLGTLCWGSTLLQFLI